MLFAVDVVQVVDAILEPALANLAVPASLLGRRGRRGDYLRLAELGGEVDLPLSGLWHAVGRRNGYCKKDAEAIMYVGVFASTQTNRRCSAMFQEQPSSGYFERQVKVATLAGFENTSSVPSAG